MADSSPKTQTRILLHEVRKARGLPAAELARMVGVSRQTIYAIEDGSYVPNTTVALHLARALEVHVEDLFALDEPTEIRDKSLRAELLGSSLHHAGEGKLVRLCRVNKRLVAIPIPSVPAYLPPADAIVEKITGQTVSVNSFFDVADYEQRLLIAGCDPALSLLTDLLAHSGISVLTISCSSRQALQLLKRGRVHAAGSHLLDRTTGQYNVPIVQRLFPKGSVLVVTFAIWEQGLVIQHGNPKGISSIADLQRNDLTIVNREVGSGSRHLLDTGLRLAGIPTSCVRGYDQIASGHLAAAYAVSAKSADCCIATQSAARRFGLAFIALALERFDLSFSQQALDLPASKALLDVLSHASLRNKLRTIAGYETQQTGVVQLSQ